MHEQVGRDAPGVVPEAAPAEEPLEVERLLRCGPQEHVPVHGLRVGVGGDGVEPRARVAVAVVARAHHGDLAQLARLDDLLRRLLELRADALRADLEQPARLRGGVDHRGPVVDRVGHRLLEVDVLARGERVDRLLLVPVVRGRDHDRVDRLVGEESAVVRVLLRLAAQALQRARDPALVRVADGDHLHAGQGDHRRHQVRLRARAHADDPDLDPVVRRHGLGQGLRLVAQHVGHERRRGHADQALLHELPAVDPCLHLAPRFEDVFRGAIRAALQLRREHYAGRRGGVKERTKRRLP